MKRLLLAVLVSSLFLSGACATDESYLTENEVRAYIWTYQLYYHLPQVGPGQISYDKNDFDTNSSTAEYLGNGVWAYVIEGSRSKTNSVETPLRDHKDGQKGFDVLRKNLPMAGNDTPPFTSSGGRVIWGGIDYGDYATLAARWREQERVRKPEPPTGSYIKDSLTTVYDVKFTANYYEKVRTLDNIAIRLKASKTEATQFVTYMGSSFKIE